MSVLLTADLHMTDRPKDRYRFDLFHWLEKQQEKHDVDATFILGDLTDAKDKHSSRLVNRIVDGIRGLRPPVFILQGNHDYIDVKNPFFKFLNELDSVTFITEPNEINIDGVDFFGIPHQPNGWPEFPKTLKPDYILIHQCVEGAIAESGARLNGLETATIERLGAKRILAGDIHRPQDVGPVAYVGAPYHIRFGDGFEPRCVLLNTKRDRVTNLHFPAPKKHSLIIRDVDEIEDKVSESDHIKISMELTREEIVDWQRHKRAILDECSRLGLEVYGCNMKVEQSKAKAKVAYKAVATKPPTEVLEDFSNKEKLSSTLRRAGVELLEG